MRSLIKSLALLSFTLITAILSCGCSQKETVVSKSGLYFDTIVNVTIYAPENTMPENLADECMNICEHYQQLFDRNIPTSDIAKINAAGTDPLIVDHDTSLLLTEAIRYSELSHGKFDITVSPLSKLWDFHGNSHRVPDAGKIHKAVSYIDYRNIHVDPSSDIVSLASPYTAIDVGGIAKGYVADRIADHLREYSITGAIINMGGDMYLLGTKPDGSLFNIGINDPFSTESCIGSLYLSDTAVATSGIYERCFTLDGIRYHHILDTTTGMPADTDIESVTVISNSTTGSDSLCTICILLGSDEAMQLIDSLPDTEAVIILSDGSMQLSRNADKYLRH